MGEDAEDFILRKIVDAVGDPKIMDHVGMGEVMIGPAHIMVTMAEESKNVVGVITSMDPRQRLFILVEMYECTDEDCPIAHHWIVEGFAKVPRKTKHRKNWNPSDNYIECWVPLQLPSALEIGLEVGYQAARDNLIDKIDKRHG